jgi:hypothetical protein
MAPRQAEPESSIIDQSQLHGDCLVRPTLMLVVAQHTIFQNEPSKLIAASVVGPLLEIALHLASFLGTQRSFTGRNTRYGLRWSATQNRLLLNTSLGSGSSGRSLQDGASLVIFGEILGKLALAISPEWIRTVQKQKLNELGILLPRCLMQERSTMLDGILISTELGGIDIYGAAHARIRQQLLEFRIVARRNEGLDLLDVGVDKDGPGELKVLINVWCPRNIQRGLALVVLNRIVDTLLVEQSAYDGCSAKRRRNMERRVSILIPAVEIYTAAILSRGHAEYILDDRDLGALYG